LQPHIIGFYYYYWTGLQDYLNGSEKKKENFGGNDKKHTKIIIIKHKI
jgi:hypothetical protein